MSQQHLEIPVEEEGFHPSENREVTVQFDDLQAVFKPTKPMRLLLNGRGMHKEVALPDNFAQLTSARLFTQKIMVITGMMSGDAYKVVVVDVESGRIVDQFPCYSPSISPNGRYVAFVKFYPSHGVLSVEHRCMLYDVTLGPSNNRPREGRRDPAVVGRIVYPKGVGNEAGDNVDVGDGPTHRMASESFFWNNDSTRFVFVDQLQDVYSAVLVRYSTDAFYSLSTVVPRDFICPKTVEACWERLTDVTYPKLSTLPVELTFRGYNGTPARESHIALTSAGSAALAVSPIK